MDLQNLEKFFLDRISVDEIVNEINSEVESFRIARLKKGSSSPVFGRNEKFYFRVRRKDIRKLCDMYLQGKFDEWHLEYLCNLIEMSDAFSFDEDEIEDALFELSSPEINGMINFEKVRDIRKNL